MTSTPTKPTDMLAKAATSYASAKASNLVSKIGDKASGNGPSKSKGNDGGNDGGNDDNDDDDSKGFIGNTMENIAGGGSAVGSAVKGLGTTIKDGVKNLFKGKGGSKRPNNIVEDLFVGVTPEVAFAAWTDYEEWSSFSKGIENVNVKRGDQVEGEDEDVDEESNWTAKVFLSRRSWNATTTDFDPPNRIAWTSEGAKGTIDGTVTFTPIGENACLILVVMEYRTKGPIEWIANRWRAAERRAKLDIKHFRRYVMRAEEDELPDPVEEPEDHLDDDKASEEPTDGEETPDEADDDSDDEPEEPTDDEDESEPEEEPEEEPEPATASATRPRPARRSRG